MRVLIVRTGAMGDVLHALPAVEALRRAKPEWFIGWVVEPRWSALLGVNGTGAEVRGDQMPVVDRWYGADTSGWKRQGVSGATLREVDGLRRTLRGERFDVSVDMQGTIRSGAIGWLAGAGRFVGSTAPRERPAGWLYREKVKTRARHVVEQGAELLGEAVGVELRGLLGAGEVTLPVDADAEDWAERLVGGERFVVIAPTAGWGAKCWPAERYGEVAAELRGRGWRVLVNAARSGDEAGSKVVEASGGKAEMVVCGVRELVALTRRAELVIGGDTGPVHLAAALGRPVVGLYGPTDPARNGPYGSRVKVLRSKGSVTNHARLVETEAGLLQIGVSEVVAVSGEMLGG